MTMLNIHPEKKVSTEFKKFFLLEFTRQLILNSAPLEILKLKEVLREKYPESPEIPTTKEEIKERVQEVLNPEEEGYEKSYMPKTEEIHPASSVEKVWPKPKLKRKTFPFETFKNVRLTIPETNLPERLRYLMPSPTNQTIDLGKLNALIADPFVRSIECSGENINVVVTGAMGEKKTPIVLTESDISEIIQTFSNASRIPASEGVFKVAVGKLIFMAIISEVVGSKFIIHKMISSKIPLAPLSPIVR